MGCAGDDPCNIAEAIGTIGERAVERVRFFRRQRIFRLAADEHDGTRSVGQEFQRSDGGEIGAGDPLSQPDGKIGGDACGEAEAIQMFFQSGAVIGERGVDHDC